jgi:hypothetical protein
MKLHIFIFLLLLSVVSNCKHPEDPCSLNPIKKPTITLYEYLGEDLLSKTDTVVEEAQVVFEAPEGFDSYTWQIGTDSRTFTSRKFYLYLRGGDIGNFDVRLITKRKPNTDCNPADTGIDTVYKTLTVVTYENSKIIGKFKGKRQELNEPDYVVDIIKKPDHNGKIYCIPTNLTPECLGELESGRLGYRAFSIGTYQWDPMPGCFTCCNMAHGYAELDTNGDFLIIKYIHIEPVNPYPRLTRTFIGKRMP